MKIVIQGIEYRVIAEGAYATKSEPDKPYKKYKLNDNKALVISDEEDFAFFGEDFGELDLEPGEKNINYKGTEFKLATEDYQILEKAVFGEPEGNLKFWDYENGEQVISLGVKENGERSDVAGKVIDKKSIKFI